MAKFHHLTRAVIILWMCFQTICVQSFSNTDVDTFRNHVKNNLTGTIQKLKKGILQPENIAALFESSRRVETKPVSTSDIKSMLTELTLQAESKYKKVELALVDLKNKLEAFIQSPNSQQNGRPHLVQACCRLQPLTQNMPIDPKVGVPVDTRDVCFTRSRATAGNGFNLWADEVMDTMKNNFHSLPAVLWQEFALRSGLHVQFPTAKRSCVDQDTSSSKLLRPWFGERLKKGPVNLVIILDASDSMTNRVFRPGSNLTPMTHWDIVNNAARKLLETLMPWDTVSVVSTGGTNVSVSSGCERSMIHVTDSTVDDLDRFIQSIIPKGVPNYQESFRQAFDLLSAQQDEHKKSGGRQPQSSNVIMLLSNGDNVVTDEDKLLQTIKDGQANLPHLTKAQIQVYAVKQLFVTSLSTWLKVADQNNQRLVTWDGSRNVSAEPWNMKTVTGPQGPPGYLHVMEDYEGFKLVDILRGYHRAIQTPSHSHSILSFIQDDSIQLLSPLQNSQQSQSYDGVVSINASLEYIFEDTSSFSFGQHSYAFVVDAVTGNIVYHPKTRKFGTRYVPWNNLYPNWTMFVLDSIRSSTDQGDVSHHQQIPIGRELFRRGLSGPEEEAFLGHSLVRGTRFIVCLVIFKSDLKTNTISTQTLPTSGKTVYHRFDLLPSGMTSCDLDGVLSSTDEDVIGLKFSPDVFDDVRGTGHNVDTVQTAVMMDRFIQQGAYPSSFKAAYKDDIETELGVIKSKRFKGIWSNSSIEPIQRFFGTKTGVLAIQPASPLVGPVSYKDYDWYWQAMTRPGITVITKERFPGRRHQLILSTAIHNGNRIHGVVACSVLPKVLQALVLSEVPMCVRSGLTCKILDSRGYIVDLWNDKKPSSSTSSDSHLTQRYPWLANKLLNKNIMRASWSYNISSNKMNIQYFLQMPARCITCSSASLNTSECRRFALYYIEGSNLFILLLADRQKTNCPPESLSPGESCAVTKSTLLVPTHPLFPTTTSSSSVFTPPTPPPLNNGPPTPPPLNNGPPTPPPLNNGPPTPPPVNNGPPTPPPLNNGPSTPPPLNNGPPTPPPLHNGPPTPPPLYSGPPTPPPLNKGPPTPPPLNKGPQTPPPLNKGPPTPPPLNNGPPTPPPLNKGPPTPPPLNNGPPTPSPLNNGPPTPPPLNKGPPTPPPLNGPPTPPPIVNGPPAQSPISSVPLSKSPTGPHATGQFVPPPPVPPVASPLHSAFNPPFAASITIFTPLTSSTSKPHPPHQPYSPLHKTMPTSSHQMIAPSYIIKNTSPFTQPPSIRSQNQYLRRANMIRTPPPLGNKLVTSSMPSSWSTPSLPECLHCKITTPSPSPALFCQIPCYCDVVIDKCTNLISWRNSNDFNIQYASDSSSEIQSPPSQKPATSPLPLCPKKCSQIVDQTECNSKSECKWDDVTHAIPICKKSNSATRTPSSKDTSPTTQSPTSKGDLSSSTPSLSLLSHPTGQSPEKHGQLKKSTPSTNSDSNDSSTTNIAIGITVSGVTLFILFLVLVRKFSRIRRLFKRRQVVDSSNNLHDGKRYSKDGLIIQVQENG